MQNIDYQAVDGKFKTQLRVEIGVNWGLIFIAVVVASFFIPPPWHWLTIAAAGLIAIVMVLLATLWVPRRYRLTGYAVEPLEVHYRTGAMWRRQTSIPINRIQHVEITQGPVERMLSLAKLVIYTAGGSGSDLAAPGLAQRKAESIRNQLLHQIGEEPEGASNDEL
jgi:membrane protein YdbS with pleckstrin-like domain